MRTVAVGTAFLLAGVVMGALTAQSWTDRNGETSPVLLMLNAPGVALGDAAYVRGIALLGDPGSAQAHTTVPPVLRVPTVYVTSSAVAWGSVGVVAGWVTRRVGRHRRPHRPRVGERP